MVEFMLHDLWSCLKMKLSRLRISVVWPIQRYVLAKLGRFTSREVPCSTP